MAPATMQYSDELFDAVRLAANEADDHDGEHAYYETWNQLLVHLGLLIRKGKNIRLTTGPQPCLSRKVFSNEDGSVDLNEEILGTDAALTRGMHSQHPSAELHKLHVKKYDKPLPSSLIPNDSLSEIDAFDETINITDNDISAISTKESASATLKVTTEKRLPDFLVFAYFLQNNDWIRHVMLIVEIKDLPFPMEGGEMNERAAKIYKDNLATRMEQMYLQVRTQAQLVFHNNPRQQFIRALCIVGLHWRMIELTRDRLPPLPKFGIWEQDLTDINLGDETTLKTRVHGIFSDDTQTSYNNVLVNRFKETFNKLKRSMTD